MYILYYINFFRYNRTVSIFWNFLSGYTSIVLQKLNAMFLRYILWYLDFGRKQPHVQALLSPLQLDFLRNLDVISEDHLRFCWCIFYFFHKIMWFCGDISNTTFAFFWKSSQARNYLFDTNLLFNFYWHIVLMDSFVF